MTIDKYLSRWFCETYNLDRHKEYLVEYVSAEKLFCPERLDLVIKYKYVEAYIQQKDMTIIKKIYKSHLRAFTEGTFREPGQEKKKRRIEDYFKLFDKLIEKIKVNGLQEKISVVPINENNIICNGSHRVAIALYFGYEVPCIRLNKISNIADYNFFRKRLMPEKDIDYMVTQYCLLKKNIYAACIWPSGYKRLSEDRTYRRVMREIESIGKIISIKEMGISYKKLDEFVKVVYYPASWLGEKQMGLPGSKGKTDACYEKNGKIVFILFEGNSFADIIQAKLKIRNYCNIGNHSIHITDNYRESIKILRWILNNYEYLNIEEIERLIKRAKRDTSVLTRSLSERWICPGETGR